MNEQITKPLGAVLNVVAASIEEALERLHGSHDTSIEVDDNGVMHGHGVTYVPTVRTQKLATPGAEGERHVEGLVWHYTDTRNAGAVNLAQRIAAKGASRSCHVWIDRLGHIAQSASFERGTWHAGSNTAALFTRQSGQWDMLQPAQRGRIAGYGANSWAAGIELENVGELKHVQGKWIGWPFRFDKREADGSLVRPVVVPDDEVAAASGTSAWHNFTPEQVAAAGAVTSALVRRYGLTRKACEWTHAAIDPTRRTDPGPVWTDEHLPKLLAGVFGPA